MSRQDFSLTQMDWSLYRQGQIDQLRHQEKIKEAIKANLPDIVSEESIIMSEGEKILKIPIRALEEYRFRYSLEKNQQLGQGKGSSRKGDVVVNDRRVAAVPSKGAGTEPGVDYYEAEITMEELEDLIFADLKLPNLQEKKRRQMATASFEFNDLRKYGLTSNVDKKRTLLANLKRNSLQGRPGLGRIQAEDLRFKTWNEAIVEKSSAVVLAMMDTSGSMGNFEKYIARSFFFWLVRFLRLKYEQVEIVFLAHHTRAKEVNEEEFFTKGESGGTRCSSVYQLAWEIIEQRYNPEEFNLYPFHFSDGDNLPSDNEKCIEWVEKILKVSNLFGYGEIINPYYRTSTLMSAFKQIQDPKFVTVTIKDKTEVYSALKKILDNPKENPGLGSGSDVVDG